MRWPWDRRRETLDRKLAEARRAKQVAEMLAEQNQQVNRSLNAEVEKNHFADMLVEAMSRRYSR